MSDIYIVFASFLSKIFFFFFFDCLAVREELVGCLGLGRGFRRDEGVDLAIWKGA